MNCHLTQSEGSRAPLRGSCPLPLNDSPPTHRLAGRPDGDGLLHLTVARTRHPRNLQQ